MSTLGAPVIRFGPAKRSGTMGNKQGKQRDPIDAQYMRPSGTLYTTCECALRTCLLTRHCL